MLTFSWRSGLVAVALYLTTSASTAQAKIMLITTGDTITHLGEIQAASSTPVPKPGPRGGVPDRITMLKMAGAKVGYKWSYGGLFWVDFWTWGGEYCAYVGDTYEPISADEAASLLGQSKAPGRPFLYKFPLGLLIVGGLLLLGVLGAIFGKKEAKEAEADDASLEQYRRPKSDDADEYRK